MRNVRMQWKDVGWAYSIVLADAELDGIENRLEGKDREHVGRALDVARTDVKRAVGVYVSARECDGMGDDRVGAILEHYATCYSVFREGLLGFFG